MNDNDRDATASVLMVNSECKNLELERSPDSLGASNSAKLKRDEFIGGGLLTTVVRAPSATDDRLSLGMK